MRSIDETDRRLIARLGRNARASVTELAGDLGLSRVTVQNRIARLREDGVIRRFTVELGDLAQEDVVRAVTLIELQGSVTDMVQRQLRRMPQISALYTTNGSWGLVAHTETRNLSEFDRVLTDIGKIKGVIRAETCLLLNRVV